VQHVSLQAWAAFTTGYTYSLSSTEFYQKKEHKLKKMLGKEGSREEKEDVGTKSKENMVPIHK
jgi:hypothetical protein